jgi:hypothetical protein
MFSLAVFMRRPIVRLHKTRSPRAPSRPDERRNPVGIAKTQAGQSVIARIRGVQAAPTQRDMATRSRAAVLPAQDGVPLGPGLGRDDGFRGAADAAWRGGSEMASQRLEKIGSAPRPRMAFGPRGRKTWYKDRSRPRSELAEPSMRQFFAPKPLKSPARIQTSAPPAGPAFRPVPA